MQKHKINCQKCGEEFESARSDAMYCSNSCKTRASQMRTKENPLIKIKFEQHEIEELSEIADEFDLSVEELIKYRSLLTNNNIKRANDLHVEMELEIKKLRAELSLHTKSPSKGLFLDISDKQKELLFDNLQSIGIHNKLKNDINLQIIAAPMYCRGLEKMNEAFLKVIKANGLGHQVKL